MSFKKFLCLLLVFVMIFAMASACGKTETDPDPDQDGSQTEVLPPEDEDDDGFVPTGNVNPLTGLCDGIADKALSRRPVAIMVSNSYDSLPQWGISQADIIYEMLAEGRITRLLAIFQDPSKIDHLASIRSARPYFIDIAQSYGAVYMHFGGSVPAYEAIENRDDLIDIDGIRGGWEGSLFFRDPDRKKQLGSEHSVYTTGEYIEEALSSLDKSLELEGSPSAFNFGEEHSALGGQSMSRVQFSFSDRHTPYFEYDPEAGTYLRYQYGEPHMDAWLDKQIEVKNLFVLRMDTTDVAGSDLHLVEVDAIGTGDGYYFCDGKYVPITWEKDGYNQPITFYDQNGQELTVARGNTFISCITATASLDIT